MFLKYMTENEISLKRNTLDTIQLNIGRKCNQSCKHCHVEAGPERTEQMNKETLDKILTLISKSAHIQRVELTGGAPELNENFRYLITKLKKMKKQIAVRSNLTVFFEEDQGTTPQFLKENMVEIIASLPCYTEENVDKQRGNGVFTKSIKALEILNDLGYGRNEDYLLNLVYNPQGLGLPGKQEDLEKDYKLVLMKEYGIIFNSLFTITNMPIGNFAKELESNNQLEEYKKILVNSFNPSAGNNIMCKSLISIDYQGNIYDCDFNQMLNLPKKPINIENLDSFDQISEDIIFEDHCFACTAGYGSSCNGALI
ncbi:MAG: arsenosugar biosynthesis radical SAM protein ArsS [Firmicutes bacterium]|nr:arsenosugar biosynthesis radical SAM protein ArsS [Bacillota bacterium]